MPRNPTTGVYEAPENSWNPAVAGTVIDPEDWNATQADYVAGLNGVVLAGQPQTLTDEQKEQARENVGLATTTADNAVTRFDGVTGATQNSGVTISDANAVSGAVSESISAANTNTTPGANTTSFLELINPSTASQFVGAELRFGTSTSNPYAVIRSGLVTGGAPPRGDLFFYTRDLVSHVLTQRLRLNASGGLYSGPDIVSEINFSSAYNYGAYLNTGKQNFLGLTELSTAGTATSGYFVGAGLAGGAGGRGVYAEGRIWTEHWCVGAEIDAQNLQGPPRSIDPNNIFGVDNVGPVVASIWSQANGSYAAQTYDNSAWLVAVKHADPALFNLAGYLKGIVIERDAITEVSGHREAIALPDNNEIAWYDSGSNVARLTSNGLNLSFTGAIAGTAFTPTGATVPTNGLFLSAANVLGLSSNSVQKVWVNSSGLGVGAAPTAGLQSTHATSASVRALTTGAGAVDIRMTATDASGAGFIGSTSNHAVLFVQNNAEVFRTASTGINLAATKTLSVASTQVVTSRRTGWTAPTGTATRTTFDTSTVTLPLLAERVKALIDDLTTHGLIGT